MENQDLIEQEVAKKFKKCFNFLRRQRKSLSTLQENRKIDIRDSKEYNFLSNLQKYGITIPVFIEKTTDVEAVIFDCSRCLEKYYPRIFNYLYSNNKNENGNIISKYYSGEKNTYIPLYILDIFSSKASQNLSPSEKLVLIDMMRAMDFYNKTRCVIKEGFYYTISDCKIGVPYETLKRAIPNIIDNGFFRVLRDKKGKRNVYFPSKEWKRKK